MELEDDKEKLPQGWPPGLGHPLTPHQLTQAASAATAVA